MKNVADIWPLAPLQELMLAHALAEPASSLLVEQFHCVIEGPLNAALLRRAWQAVVARHALLRSAPAWDGLKKPVLVVRREVELPWTELDLRGDAEEQRQARCKELLAESRGQGFSLAEAPLMRFQLARLREREWRFVWTCHHLLLDGWSLGIVLREVFQWYAQAVLGQPGELEQCGNFADYLQWLAAQNAAECDEFWRGHLGDLGPSLRLPVEEIQDELIVADAGHEECALSLAEADTARLSQAALAARVSQGVLLQAAWAILLARYAEREDVTFGMTVSGRPPEVPRVDALVGPLVNNVPLRVRVTLDERLPELYERLRGQQVARQPFEYASPRRIADAVGRADGRMFESLVVYENYPLHDADVLRVGDVTIRDMHGTATSNYPLTLVALPGRQLRLRLLYDRRKFAPATATRLLAQTAALLRGMGSRPQAQIRDLPLVDEGVFSLTAACRDGQPTPHVLDAAGQSAPEGMPGRLVVAERGANGATRLRDTGYRAAYQAGGEIECLGPDCARGVASGAGSVSAAVRIGRWSVVPQEIAAVLMLHPVVESVAVTVHTDCHGTTRLAAFVVPTAESSLAIESGQSGLFLSDLRRFAAERLPAPMIPTAWRTIESLPVDPRGQVDVSALPAPMRAREARHPYVPPRDALEARVAALWSELLGVAPVGVTDRFLEMGGYSSLAVSLVARMELEFGRRLPLAALFEEPTVAHLAKLLRAARGANEMSSLVAIRPGGTRAPLFCVHPAGGTVFCYLELAAHLAADIPLYGLQARGVDGTLAPHDAIEDMAAHYITAMKSVQEAGPYRLCGWSTGGVVAFEIARQLLEEDREVSLVALLDAAVPSAERALDENDLVPMLQLMFPGESPDRLRRLRELPLTEQVDYFRERAEAARLLLAGAGAGGARAVYDVFEANIKAVVAYRPQPVAAPLTLIRAAEHATPMHADPLLGWGPWAAAGSETFTVPGGHLAMLQQPSVAALAEILERCLLAAEGHPAAAGQYCRGS